MRTIHVKCPHCNSEYDVAAEKESVFCMECGTTITVTEQSKKEYTYNHNVNIDNKQTYRKVDDARIREADVQETIRLRELEIELLKMQDESRQKKFALYLKFGVLAVCLLIIVALIFLMVLPIDEDIKGACLILAVIMIIVVAVIIPKLFRNK